MSVELRPLGVRCNLQCQYCYQNPQRDAGNLGESYDMVAMKAAVEAEGGPFTLFGGEPLLVPHEDLEELWAWGLEKYGSNSIQTNGALIDDRHIEMFRRYKVGIGISIDGPEELNDVRWMGTEKRTRETTKRIESNIRRLCEEGLSVSLIVTLHRDNSRAERLPRLLDWTRYMASIGVNSIRLHLLESESDTIRQRYALTTAENIAALHAFRALERELPALNFDLFEDVRRLLVGDDSRTTCVWNACDPFTTAAVRGVEGHGQRSNCGRTNKEGIDFVKADVAGFERYPVLFLTPMEHGGCRSCRFFFACKGQCPGTAINGDWRNRTEHCQIWMDLFEEIEEELIAEGTVPISRSPVLVDVNQELVSAWQRGENRSIHSIIASREVSPPAQPVGPVWRQNLQQAIKMLEGS
jgi:uncharacterized protein